MGFPASSTEALDLVPPEHLEPPPGDELRYLVRDECALLLDGYLRRLARQEALGGDVLGSWSAWRRQRARRPGSRWRAAAPCARSRPPSRTTPGAPSSATTPSTKSRACRSGSAARGASASAGTRSRCSPARSLARSWR